MTTPTASVSAVPATAATGVHRFRPEVQGLRALAVLLVAVYHLDADLMPGGYVGVDVFFVISGFLITTLLVREAEREGRISLAGFYARRIRRILPAATLVLVVTGVATVLLLPATRLEDTARQLIASALYVENLYLAGQAVDYLAAETVPSPVQHFWSLAVEEQFYLVWPLLFLAWAGWGRRTRRAGRLLVAAVAVIVVASFGCSLWLTATDTARAYFLPHTRMWELAAGGLLALLLLRAEVPERARGALGVLGLAAILAAALGYDDATSFPGHAAALPVLGACAIIAAGHDGSRRSVGALLASAPARLVGDLSYALYLWHWPIIVIAVGWSGRSLTPVSAAAVLALSFALAWATKVAVEDPIRTGGALRRLRPGLAFAVAGALTVGVIGGGQLAHAQRLRAVEFDPSVHTGPRALEAGDTPQRVTEPIFPAPLAATDDLPDLYADDCQTSAIESVPRHCVYGPEGAATEVALVGDSHAAHWLPTVQELAGERGWRVHVFTKASCVFTATLIEDPQGRPYHQCREWGEAVVSELSGRIRPDMVFTSSNTIAEAHGAGSRGEGRDLIAEGMARLWTELEAGGAEVVAIRDTPQSRPGIAECVERGAGVLTACTRTREDALDPDPQFAAAELVGGRARVVDLSDLFCTSEQCPPVVGNVLVYRDGHHITATYARLLAPYFAELLDEDRIRG
ncbi:acyltransferase family protein [Marinactinospora thermotolerans]|uniref:acyltransferase family protein n=1 Tax=Marinactinospora thermotolerans TaxID=531310 RepID=UPI003D93C030